MTGAWREFLGSEDEWNWNSYRRAIRDFRRNCPAFEKLPKAGERFIKKIPGLHVSPSVGTWSNLVANKDTKPKWEYVELLVLIWGEHHGLSRDEVSAMVIEWARAYKTCGGDPGPRFADVLLMETAVGDANRLDSSQEGSDGDSPATLDSDFSMQDLVRSQQKTIGVYEEMRKAWHAYEMSERGRVQAVQIYTVAFSLLSASTAKVAELNRRIDVLTEFSNIEDRGDMRQLRQKLERATIQRQELEKRLERAERERDEAQAVADFAARKAMELELSLKRAFKGHSDPAAASPSGLPANPGDLLDTETNELDSIDRTIEKMDMYLDRGNEDVHDASETMGLPGYGSELNFGGDAFGSMGMGGPTGGVAKSPRPHVSDPYASGGYWGPEDSYVPGHVKIPMGGPMGGPIVYPPGSADRVLTLAQQTADQAIAEARREANKIVGTAKEEFELLEVKIQQARTTLQSLEPEELPDEGSGADAGDA